MQLFLWIFLGQTQYFLQKIYFAYSKIVSADEDNYYT